MNLTMEFPELPLDSDLYNSWNPDGFDRSSYFFNEIDGINSDKSRNQVVIEDVCLSTQTLPVTNRICESNENILTGLTDKTFDSFDPKLLTQDSILHMEQSDSIHGAKNNTDEERDSSSQIPSLLNCASVSSKQTPTILVVADSSVSSFGKRGPPVGDPNSKNAIAARDNRLKKKKYIAELESTVRQLKSENVELLKENAINRKSVAYLQHEVKYLKGVIANQSTLSALLKSVSQTPGIILGSSVHQPSTDWLEKNLPYDLEAHSEVSSSVQNKTELKMKSGSRRCTTIQGSLIPSLKMVQHSSNVKGPYALRKKGSLCQAKFRLSKTKKMRVKNTNEEGTINIEDSDSDTDDSDMNNFNNASVMKEAPESETEENSPSDDALHAVGLNFHTVCLTDLLVEKR